MAIARDAHGNASNSGQASCSISSFTLSSNNSLLLVVVYSPNTGSDLLTGVTFDGTSLTRVATYGYQSWDTRRLWLYYGLGLSGSAKTITATFSSSQNSIGMVAQSYTDVAQTGFPNASNGNGVTGNGTSASVTTSVDNCWVAAGGCSTFRGTLNSGTYSAGTPGGESEIFDHNGVVSPAGSQSLGWASGGDSGAQNGIIVVAFAPYVAASSAVKTYNDLAYVSNKTVNGLAIASVKTKNDLA